MLDGVSAWQAAAVNSRLEGWSRIQSATFCTGSALVMADGMSVSSTSIG